MTRQIVALGTLLVALAPSRPVRAQTAPVAHHARADTTQVDGAFSALQRRGRTAMGVDQYTSHHHFVSLPDGGQIELQRNTNDTAGAAQIRRHLHEVARSFAAGDFSSPAFVHARSVPGTDIMAARHALIRYDVIDLPRGGAIRITTTDSSARRAVHDFLAFQASDHRTGDSARVNSPGHHHHGMP
ncbi:MAG TPA: hypothetical protein VIC55_11905 [Gemmatimonadaceae bacterium]|jgi:hypothetical protein